MKFWFHNACECGVRRPYVVRASPGCANRVDACLLMVVPESSNDSRVRAKEKQFPTHNLVNDRAIFYLLLDSGRVDKDVWTVDFCVRCASRYYIWSIGWWQDIILYNSSEIHPSNCTLAQRSWRLCPYRCPLWLANTHTHFVMISSVERNICLQGRYAFGEGVCAQILFFEVTIPYNCFWNASRRCSKPRSNFVNGPPEIWRGNARHIRSILVERLCPYMISTIFVLKLKMINVIKTALIFRNKTYAATPAWNKYTKRDATQPADHQHGFWFLLCLHGYTTDALRVSANTQYIKRVRASQRCIVHKCV